ncbi:MAG TPA: hypothetical protein VFR58_00760 [Flavisolibacter sp.]|nr:hypothetical protein [Flavisolibacter sp.]
MKKTILVFFGAVLLLSCNNSSENPVEDKLDSLEARKDTLLDNIDSTTEAQTELLKERREKLKDKFDSSIEAKKDSLKKISGDN